MLIYSEELEEYLPEFRVKEKIKTTELKNKKLQLEGRGDTVIGLGGDLLLAGRKGQERFILDKEKLVFGKDRQTVFFKEVKKNGAFTLLYNDKTEAGYYLKKTPQ